MTAATSDPKAKTQKTRISRLLLPQVDPNSALLPPDKWILKTAYEFVKDNKSFHDTIGRAAVYTGLGFSAIVAGTVGAFLLFPLALPMAAAGAAAIGAAVFSGVKVKHHVGRFMKETLPGLRAEVGKNYLEYKMSELKAAWQRNLDERRKKKAEAKKDAPAPQKQPEAAKPEAKKPEPKVEAPKVETPAPQPAAADKTAAPAPEAKKPEKKTLGGAFADFARKMAEERARKLKEQEAKADKPADKKPGAPEAPKPPAP